MLGPVEARLDGAPVDLGGPLQRSVLALLLVERGGVVSVDRMIDQLWHGEPPRRATASLQAYVSNLRKLIEPDRPPRAPARVLISTPPGYALRLPADAVDAWRFEAAIREARTASPERAAPLLAEALGLWRGRPYADLADAQWASAEIARLSEIQFVGRETAVQVALRLDRPETAIPDADALTREQPLREEGWRLLALALCRTGRRAEALDTLRRSRRLFADELGLDPGPALVALEKEILTGWNSELPEPSTVSKAKPPDPFVGREAELTALTATSVGTVLVTGEPGAGKTHLLEVAGRRLRDEGRTVVVGRCPEHAGAPPAWAWSEALRELARRVPPPDPDVLAPLLRADGPALRADEPVAEGDTARGRFLLHRAAGRWLRAAAEAGPVALILDDLHHACLETLALLEAVAELSGPRILIIGAYRPQEADDRLARTLAVLARHSPRRVPLPGLEPDAVGALVAAVCGGPVDDTTVAAVAERTGGNPFYVKESARLLASEGALIAISEVPQGVRDVLRRRLDRLPADAVAVLRLAAVAGRESDVDLLVEASDAGEQSVLDGLDAGLIAGLLTEPAAGRVRFTHALVRDTLYTDLSRTRRWRTHARIAAALRELRPDDLSALAHHHTSSATAATASLAVEYSVAAAEAAERRYAYDVAVDLLRQAAETLDRLPQDDDRTVDLLTRLLRAQLQAGSIATARDTRQRVIDLAAEAGRDDLLIRAFAAWSEPLPWQKHGYGSVDQPVIDAIERLLARDDLPPETRCPLLGALVAELTGTDSPRLPVAADEQLRLARAVGDPALLAAALTSVAKPLPHEWYAEVRVPYVEELRKLSEEHGFPGYQWICEHLGGSVAAARGDKAELRRHADAGLALARRYRLVEQEAAHIGTLAMIAHIEGRFDEAAAGYVAARDAMDRHGSIHAWPAYALSAVTLAFSSGRYAEAHFLAQSLYEAVGPLAGDLFAVLLIRQGRLDEARSIRRDAPLGPDHAYSIRICLRAESSMAFGESAAVPGLIRLLEPMRDQLAGAAGTAHAMRPIAHVLGDLRRFQGDDAGARAEYRHAVAIAERWGSPHWSAEARAALRR
ncbi:BTAD domain-containing putative transcriptional regulator [Streptomyces canus]|uniref:BTAD domain-containing putative transcriptional regulator n=1 Tax=Streptomyces canus TaxID=58343 RepID=UPI003806BE28